MIESERVNERAGAGRPHVQDNFPFNRASLYVIAGQEEKTTTTKINHEIDCHPRRAERGARGKTNEGLKWKPRDARRVAATVRKRNAALEKEKQEATKQKREKNGKKKKAIQEWKHSAAAATTHEGRHEKEKYAEGPGRNLRGQFVTDETMTESAGRSGDAATLGVR